MSEQSSRPQIADRSGQSQRPAMSPDSLPNDAGTHVAAIRIARRCRRVIQACLREEEWADADREFYHIVRAELATLGQGDPAAPSGESP